MRDGLSSLAWLLLDFTAQYFSQICFSFGMRNKLLMDFYNDFFFCLSKEIGTCESIATSLGKREESCVILSGPLHLQLLIA